MRSNNPFRNELQHITGIPFKIEDQGFKNGAFVHLHTRGKRAKGHLNQVKIVAVYPEADIRAFSQAQQAQRAIVFYARADQALPL